MALKIIDGVVEAVGPASPLASETGPTGTSWTFVRFARGKRKPLTLEHIIANATLGARISPATGGRFAFYPHEGQLVLCGFAGPDGVEIAPADSDPAQIAADALRLPAKRKIFLGVLLVPTIIGLVFAIDMIKAGRRTLSEHPGPKRPSDQRLTRALERRGFWPFWR